MPRLFIALDFPDFVKDAIARLKTLIPSARWVNPAGMHLTLRFLGDVDEGQFVALKSALGTLDSPPFALTVQGVGRFPPSPKKAPRVLWVGIQPEPLLDALQAQVASVVRELGFPPDDKPFKPHITLARLKTHKPTPEADMFLDAHSDFALPSFEVQAFYLVSSVLSPQGAQYTHEAAYPLLQAAD